ncbi:MAG: hypothetical protein NTX50_11220, partial [Candidatus Sumerlaeota bacterium]|nr:hypothetical protein [Candidatus Sumerlaeota bacterium]
PVVAKGNGILKCTRLEGLLLSFIALLAVIVNLPVASIENDWIVLNVEQAPKDGLIVARVDLTEAAPG